jgi:hypothetical protein
MLSSNNLSHLILNGLIDRGKRAAVTLDFDMERFAVIFPDEGTAGINCPHAACGKPFEF